MVELGIQNIMEVFKIRKLLSVFFSIALIITLLPISAFAEINKGSFNEFGMKNEKSIRTNQEIEKKGDWNEFDEKFDVPLNKEWTITFSGEVTHDKIDGMVIEINKKFIPVEIELTGNNTATVKSVRPFEEGEKYTLKVFLNNGKRYNMYFNTITIEKEPDRPGVVTHQYKDNYAITNTSEQAHYAELKTIADSVTYHANGDVERIYIDSEYVEIPSKATAIISFNEEMNSSILRNPTSLTVQKTTEQALLTVTLADGMSGEWTYSTKEPQYFAAYGENYFVYDDMQRYLRKFERDQGLTINKGEKISLQADGSGTVKASLPARYATFKVYEEPLVKKITFKPEETYKIVGNNNEAKITTTKNSKYDYALYNRSQQTTIDSVERSLHERTIALSRNDKYIVTNTGKESFDMYSVFNEVTATKQEDPALLSEILLPNKTTIWKNTGGLYLNLLLNGESATDYATFFEDGRVMSYGKKNQPEFGATLLNRIDLNQLAAAFITNKGVEPIVIKGPFLSTSYEAGAEEALVTKVLAPGKSVVGKNINNDYNDISIIGDGSYDYATYSGNGYTQQFNREVMASQFATRVGIHGNGESIITNSGKKPLVLFGPKRLSTLDEINEVALKRNEILPNEKTTLTNNSFSYIEVILSGNGKYEYTLFTREGEIQSSGKRTLINAFINKEVLPPNGVLEIVNTGDDLITSFAPNRSVK